MRARAIGQASGRAPGRRTRAAHVLSFLVERGLELPELKSVGERLLVPAVVPVCARDTCSLMGGSTHFPQTTQQGICPPSSMP
jgi:hypothetical protein